VNRQQPPIVPPKNFENDVIAATILKKLIASDGDPIQYHLHTEEGLVLLNDFIGQEIKIEFSGIIYCKRCGRQTKKSFSQGFCYPCFRSAPEASPCIIRPELCEAHLGKGRDVDWEQRYHNQPHVVYLAASSAIKVGVTQAAAVPTRWIDQGASAAVIIARTPHRQIAGMIEVELKKQFTDKTHWQKMLRNEVLEEVDFQESFNIAKDSIPDELKDYLHLGARLFKGRYPVAEYPNKVVSFNQEKYPSISGVLNGIKGQYLIFDASRVINIRKYQGYEVRIS
jgi:hypothetical protein